MSEVEPIPHRRCTMLGGGARLSSMSSFVASLGLNSLELPLVTCNPKKESNIAPQIKPSKKTQTRLEQEKVIKAIITLQDLVRHNRSTLH